MRFRYIFYVVMGALFLLAVRLYVDRVEDEVVQQLPDRPPEEERRGSRGLPSGDPDSGSEKAVAGDREDGWEEAAPPGAFENDMIVRFRDGEERRRFLSEIADLDVRQVETIPGLNVVRIRYGDSRTGARLRRALPPGASTEYNHLVLSPTLPPPVEEVESGPFYGFGEDLLRWLGVPEDNRDWGRGVTVAVLDTGIVPHPVFEGAFIPVVDLLGDNAPGYAYHGHGTAVASLMGGRLGVAPGANLFGVRVLDGDGAGSSFHLARGIYEAVSRGARVIPMALGTYGDSALLREAVIHARENGVVLLAAAGNEGLQGLPYPAAYEEVIAVTAIDAERRRPPFANVDSRVDIAAPGVGILAAWEDEESIEFSGTSAAVAVAGGVVAALLSKEPTISPARMTEILRGNADDVGAPGPDPETGAGVLNLRRIFDRDEPGIYDLALAGFYLSPEAREGDGPLQVIVQNRGTETVDDVQVEVVFDGEGRRFEIGSLGVNEVGVAELTLPLERLTAPGGIEVLARTHAPRIEDDYPENNVKGAHIGLAPEVEE